MSAPPPPRPDEIERGSHEAIREVVTSNPLFELSVDMLSVLDRQGHFICVNPSLCTALGHSCERLQDKPAFDFIHPDDIPKAKQHNAHVAAGETGRDLLCRFLTADGGERLLSWNCRWDPERQLIFAAARDVTEQRAHHEAVQQILDLQTEELMRALSQMEESDTLHRQIVETSLEGIWVIDREGRTTFANRQMAEMLKTTPEEMLGKHLTEAFMDDEGRAISERNLERRREGVAEQHEFKLIRTDGTELWTLMSTNPLRDSEGNITGALAMVADISELHATRQELASREAIFRGAIRCARGVPYETRMGPGEIPTAYHHMDPAVEELLGVPADELTPQILIGMIQEVRMTGENPPATFSAYCQEVTDGMRDRYMADMRMLTPQGEEKWVSDCSVVVRDRGGNHLGCLGILQDVTARHRAEEERAALQTQVLEAKRSESLAVLAGGMAQDINNLLQGIMGNVDLMQQDLPQDSDLQPLLSDVQRSAERVADMATNMLAYAGRATFASESLSLRELLDGLVGEMAPCFSERRRLDLDLEPSTPTLKGDRQQMSHILRSLIMNGVEALPEEGGRVSVRTRGIHATRGTVHEVVKGTEIPEGPCALIEVTDDGHGMDRETCERIFEPFFTTKMSGRGLGLAATLGIVKRHGGCLSLASKPGKGTTMRVLLPAEVSPPA